MEKYLTPMGELSHHHTHRARPRQIPVSTVHLLVLVMVPSLTMVHLAQAQQSCM